MPFAEAVTDLNSPIRKLFEHSIDIMQALENQKEPPKFSKADGGKESQFLKAIGIPYGEDMKGERIELANRMARAHYLVLDGLQAGKSWDDILKAANREQKDELKEYERLRMADVMTRISSEAKTAITFDPKTRTFTMAASDLRAEKARYVLRDIAVAMGGEREPLTILGYKEDSATG
jgi:hypothetical protein